MRNLDCKASEAEVGIVADYSGMDWVDSCCKNYVNCYFAWHSGFDSVDLEEVIFPKTMNFDCLNFCLIEQFLEVEARLRSSDENF